MPPPEGVAEEVPPDPAALIESMRAFGYSLPTAVADLIDNSITASARNIQVGLSWHGGLSTLSIRDDGAGMSQEELVAAMRLGSTSPNAPRSAKDLGRFGLGLKTAAFSQARSLCVITRTAGQPATVRRWDLDHVIATGTWTLLDRPLAPAPDELLPSRDGGTLVLLEHLDRLVGDADPDDAQARARFLERARSTETHLASVFHRYLGGKRLAISINGNPIAPWDPFLESHPATQTLSQETLPCGDGRITITPFVLPHSSKLSPQELERAGGAQHWNAQQGFYVYRGERLLVAGSWLGLPELLQEQQYKLARIRVDLDNTMDAAWQIDVRKATARPPSELRSSLLRIAKLTRARARDVFGFRGKIAARSNTGQLSFVWERVNGRDGVVHHRINRSHPIIAAMLDAAPDRSALQTALTLAEETLPIEAILIHARDRPEETEARGDWNGRTQELFAMLAEMHRTLVTSGQSPEAALNALRRVEPFDSQPALIAALQEELP